MKTQLIWAILIAASVGCSKNEDPVALLDNNTDPCSELSQYIIDNYTLDAKNLYFDRVLKDQSHPNRGSFEINPDSITSILKDIQAVYCLDIPERDTVFDLNSIHGYYCASFNSLGLRVDPSLPHINKLANGEFPTGDANLDQFLLDFDLDSVRLAYSFPQFPWLTVFSKVDGNNLVHMDALQNVTGIEVTELYSGCVGDGNNITHHPAADSNTLVFSIGSGDCPAGCIYHRYWEFEIKDGKAEFIRMFED